MSWRGVDSRWLSSDSGDEGGYHEPPRLWGPAQHALAASFSKQDPELRRLHEQGVEIVPNANGFVAHRGGVLLCVEICGRSRLVGTMAADTAAGFAARVPLFTWSLNKNHVLSFRSDLSHGYLLQEWPAEWSDPWTLVSLAILLGAFDSATFGTVRELAAAIDTAQGVRAVAFPGRTWAPWEQLARVQARRDLWKQ
jgi:hypothetical protein